MKQTARAKRLARQAPLPATPGSLGLDATLYADAVRYLFDRPVPGRKEREWYWDMDGPEFEATPLQWTHIQTVLFANAGSDLAPYSDEQVGMGLTHVMSNNAGDIPLMAADPSVPLADSMRMLQAFTRLWSDCIGPRLAHVHESIGSSSGRLGYACYMWFDVWPTFWNARHIPSGAMRCGRCSATCWRCLAARCRSLACMASATREATCSAQGNCRSGWSNSSAAFRHTTRN